MLFTSVQLLESTCSQRLTSSCRTEYNCRWSWHCQSWYWKSHHHYRLYLISMYYDPDPALGSYIYKLIYPWLWTSCIVVIPTLQISVTAGRNRWGEVEKRIEWGAGVSSLYYRSFWAACFLRHGRVHFDQSWKVNYLRQWVHGVGVYEGKR